MGPCGIHVFDGYDELGAYALGSPKALLPEQDMQEDQEREVKKVQWLANQVSPEMETKR